MNAYWPSLRPALVDHGRLLEAITLEGELLVRSATGARGDLEVPGCPGLTVAETVRHTGSLYRKVLAWIRDGEEPNVWQRAPDDDDLVAFHTDGRRALVAELADHRPDEPCATWWPADRTYGFWRRRIAHDTAVHRVDVQAAIGLDVDPVHADFAADGVDEILLAWFGHRLVHDGYKANAQGAVGIETAGRAWLAILSTVRCSARRVPAVDARAADAVVTGSPMNVYRWLWGRLPNQSVEIDGDLDASAQLWGLLRLATQ